MYVVSGSDGHFSCKYYESHVNKNDAILLSHGIHVRRYIAVSIIKWQIDVA